jgi:hypothetical protein
MKHSDKIVEQVVKMTGAGISSRKVAEELGIGKSTVNDIWNRWIADPHPFYNPDEVAFKQTEGPKILVFDTETAAATALTFGRFKVNLSQDNILDNGGWILCACWRWLGSNVTQSIHLTPEEVLNKDDSRIIAKLFELYEEADAVLAHNSLGFDHKVVQARAIYNGFPPLPQVKVLDTLQLVKKYLKLPSNRLDAIGEFFGLGRKISTGGISLWRKVQEGDEEAMQQMVEYCVQDVDLLYEVYLRTRQLGRAGSDFNAALYYNDDLVRCRVCGSSEVEATGRTVETALNSFDEVRCNECGAVHRHRTPKTTKEKRKSLLM